MNKRDFKVFGHLCATGGKLPTAEEMMVYEGKGVPIDTPVKLTPHEKFEVAENASADAYHKLGDASQDFLHFARRYHSFRDTDNKELTAELKSFKTRVASAVKALKKARVKMLRAESQIENS
jgi:hypothetical protein